MTVTDGLQDAMASVDGFAEVVPASAGASHTLPGSLLGLGCRPMRGRVLG